jgi:hypothetical protein
VPRGFPSDSPTEGFFLNIFHPDVDSTCHAHITICELFTLIIFGEIPRCLFSPILLLLAFTHDQVFSLSYSHIHSIYVLGSG